MAKLTAARRKALPASKFALSKGHYPIPDISHARNALARAAGNATPSQQATIRSRVHAAYPSIKLGGRGK